MPLDGIPSNGAESSRPQADPLPSKRGEIGYIEEVEPRAPTNNLHSLNAHDLSTRLSVDRIHSPVSPDAVIPPAQSEVTTCPSSNQLSSTASIAKPNGMLDFFKPQGPPAFGGLRLYTLLIFALQLTLLGGTITAWAFTSKRLTMMVAEKKHSTPFEQPTAIPVHIIFVVIVFVQLVLLERLLFRLRGERYNYVHHGEILPRHRDTPRSSMTSTLAPWNHPSPPTYATALSQSGAATGDVEDHLIAGSPPPAYNNTRGSTLVLSGFPRNSLGRESGTDRPLSYISRDEQRPGDQVQNAERVRRLEEITDRLEPPPAAYIAR